MQGLFPLPTPEISTDHSSSADGAVAKNMVVAAPDAWEFVASFNSTPDPNVDISAWTSLGELSGSDDGGAAWTKHCGNGASGPMMAARYRLYGHWSLFSVPIYTEA